MTDEIHVGCLKDAMVGWLVYTSINLFHPKESWRYPLYKICYSPLYKTCRPLYKAIPPHWNKMFPCLQSWSISVLHHQIYSFLSPKLFHCLRWWSLIAHCNLSKLNTCSKLRAKGGFKNSLLVKTGHVNPCVTQLAWLCTKREALP